MSNHPWLTTYQALGLQWDQLPALPEKTLSDYVQDHAQRYAERAALTFAGTILTYRELDERASQLAHGLRAAGLIGGDRLAIQLPNTPQYVVGLIAAARLGVVVTSLSPLLTAREASGQCQDANVKALLTLDDLYDAMGAVLAKSVPSLSLIAVTSAIEWLPQQPACHPTPLSQAGTRVIGLSKLLDSDAAMPLQEPVSMDAVLYLQYTGGTTGKPKGAQLTSRQLFTNNVQANVFYGYREGMETVASAFPFFHIGGAAVLFNALRTASTFMVIPDPRNIDAFCVAMQAHPPTVIAGVPALFQMLMANDTFRQLDFSQLRMAISGAAPFSEEGIRQLAKLIGEDRFCEVYGMTETAPVQTLNPANRFKPGYVGVPLPGTEVRIVDAETGTQDLLLGEVGEVIVSGPQVMNGYLNAPVATQEALREHGGRQWMYTGDIGFMDEEGYLKICDRSKDMLIVGGYKVFSVEIESKLAELPFVALCAVVGKPDTKRPGNEIVQLYVQCTTDTVMPEVERRDRIMQFCRENLAPYKVPKETVFMESIPLTSVGKIDKKVLREQSLNRASA